MFNKTDYTELNKFFINTDWTELYIIDNIDDKVDWFNKILFQGFTLHVPVFMKKTSDFPRWFSSELIRLVKLKKKAHSRYKQDMTSSNYKSFSNLRSICKKLGTSCYKNYVAKTETHIHQNTKKF